MFAFLNKLLISGWWFYLYKMVKGALLAMRITTTVPRKQRTQESGVVRRKKWQKSKCEQFDPVYIDGGRYDIKSL